MHFVNNRAIQAAHESGRIAAGGFQRRVVVQRNVGPVGGGKLADERGFPALARTRDHDDRRVLERGGYARGGEAPEMRGPSVGHFRSAPCPVRIDRSSNPDYRLVQSGM